MYDPSPTAGSPSSFPTVDHAVDLCVVGGGMAGLCAALAAARRGARVLLLQDRPVLGGNASSEIRMHICGCHGALNLETGIIEELRLANLRYNAGMKHPLWDGVLWGAAMAEPNLTLLLNTSCIGVDMAGGRIIAVTGWQLTAQCRHHVSARFFADCSGDGVLRISGADHRWGREARHEHDEAAAPVVADRKTMGNSLLIQVREVDAHRPFVPPPWAHVFTTETLGARVAQMTPTGHNFWWLEVGGEQDTIADNDAIHTELMKIAYGTWAFIKNHPDGRGHGWELDWIGALPGKRENVRYLGPHILTQNDIEAGGRFPDIVAYGGWTMDDHPPGAFYHDGQPTTHYPAPTPYGIPYRCLYSRNVPNLFFAGRNISATHMAMSSTRVMATAALLGQAVGTAAAIANTRSCDPQAVHDHHLAELQAALMDDDCWLPGLVRQVPTITRSATLTSTSGDAARLRDGHDRDRPDAPHGWDAPAGSSVELRLATALEGGLVRIVLDSDLDRQKRLPHIFPREEPPAAMPARLARHLRLEVDRGDGRWQTIQHLRDNPRRLLRLTVTGCITAVRLVIESAWGGADARVMSFEIGTIAAR